MRSATISLAFKDFIGVSQHMGEDSHDASKPTLRLALLDREQLCFPSSSEWLLRILSGKAWVSFAGQDYFLGDDDRLAIPRVKDGAIISAIGDEVLFFEITQGMRDLSPDLQDFTVPGHPGDSPDHPAGG